MSSSAILAQCDMVLALSSNTINYQFSQLWKRNVIEKDWKLLVRVNQEKGKPPTYDVLTQADSTIDKAISDWITTQTTLAKLYEEGDYQEFGTLLAQAKKEGLLWDYGWNGAIDAPTMSILKSTATDVLFRINFASGTLYHAPDPTKELLEFDLSGVVYAFNVPVGTIEITDAGQIITPEAKEQINATITGSGLNQSDFTIESLFMEFENANIANFDEQASKFPPNMTTSLQVTVEDYFKLVVAKSKNPYILGYGLNVKPINAPHALFQPTSLRYSTSYNEDANLSAFNFLMMVNGEAFPSGQNVGILPNSLLLKANHDPSIDGILAIDFTIFNQHLLQPFVEAIEEVITKGFKTDGFKRSNQSWSLKADKSKQYNVSSPPSDFFKDTHMNQDLSVQSDINLSNGSNDNLLFDCLVKYDLNIKIRPWMLIYGGYTTAYEAWLSTSGNYREGPDGKKGQKGEVQLSILPGAEGAVQFTFTKSQIPEIGYTKKPYVKSSGGVGVWAIIQADWNADSANNIANQALRSAQKIANVPEKVKSNLQEVINSLSIGKVILPLGQVYTYQDIQLYSTNQESDNPILLNAAYAPISD